jgi:hypothetical protein
MTLMAPEEQILRNIQARPLDEARAVTMFFLTFREPGASEKTNLCTQIATNIRLARRQARLITFKFLGLLLGLLHSTPMGKLR